jgi:hypothetical protein
MDFSRTTTGQTYLKFARFPESGAIATEMERDGKI